MTLIKNSKQFLIIMSIFISPHILQAGDWDNIWKFYKEKNYSRAIEIGINELKENENNSELNLIVGRAYTDSHQFKKAIPFLSKGIQPKGKMNWISGWSYAYLGKCYILTDQYKKSKESYKKCIQLNATKNSVNMAKKSIKALQMIPFFDSWKIVETEHIRFHFQEIDKIKNVNKYTNSREEAYRKNNEFFSASLYKKIDFYVWENPEDAKKMYGRSLGWASSNFVLINSKKNQTKGHEITHILVAFGLHPTKTCNFINEGIAVYFDLSNRDRLKAAKKSVKDKQIDVVEHWKKSYEELNDYDYTVGGAFMEYLFETRRDEEIKKMLKNQTVENAKKVFSDFDKLIATFEKRLNN